MSDFLVKTSGQELTDDNGVEALLCLHGWGMNSHVWEPVREALESRYHILWIDLPGHGINRHLKAHSLEHMVDYIAESIPKDIPNKIHLMGWSLGGLVAQALAQSIPNKVKSLTLVASTLRFSQQLDESPKWQHAMSEEVLNRFADNLKQDTEKTLKGFIALQFIGVENAKEAQDKLIRHILFNSNKGDLGKKGGGVILEPIPDEDAELKSSTGNIPTQEALEVGLTILKQADLRSTTTTCPEHWIFAKYDRLIPKDVINDLKSLRPDAEITLLEKAGHAPFITHSENFLQHMNEFIEAQSC